MSKNNLHVLLITTSINEGFYAYYPPNIKRSVLSEIQNIVSYIKFGEEGDINTGISKFYYSPFEKSKSQKFLLTIKVDYKYKESLAYSFLKELSDSLSKLEVILTDDGLSSEAKQTIKKFYEQYKITDTKGNFIKHSEDVKLEVKEGGFGIKLSDKDSAKKENKKDMKSSMLELPSLRRGLVNKTDGSEEIRNNIMHEYEEDQFYMKGSLQLENIGMWKRAKQIFLIICLILAVMVYITIPFLINIRR